jgi:hypothetical protein
MEAGLHPIAADGRIVENLLVWCHDRVGNLAQVGAACFQVVTRT